MRARTPAEMQDRLVSEALLSYLSKYGSSGCNEWDFVDYVVAQIFVVTEGEKVTFWAEKAKEWSKQFPPPLPGPKKTRSRSRKRDLRRP